MPCRPAVCHRRRRSTADSRQISTLQVVTERWGRQSRDEHRNDAQPHSLETMGIISPSTFVTSPPSCIVGSVSTVNRVVDNSSWEPLRRFSDMTGIPTELSRCTEYQSEYLPITFGCRLGLSSLRFLYTVVAPRPTSTNPLANTPSHSGKSQHSCDGIQLQT
jgi:hypothetical protein